MKRIISIFVLTALCTALVSCRSVSGTHIYMISREDGSGTRAAFSSSFGVLDGNGIDAISGRAEKVTSTSAVLATVARNKNAVGYASMSALGKNIKALSVDGIYPSAENIVLGRYTVARPFIICFKKDEHNGAVFDFIDFINSTEGQKIISESGYIPVSHDAQEYAPKNASGKVTLAGSTSVSPVIERLADEYKRINHGVEIEIQQTGSGAGIQSVKEGACDIGMSSRHLTSGELESLVSLKIAYDGIAVIVNRQNTITNISSENVRDIFIGKITDWSEIKE